MSQSQPGDLAASVRQRLLNLSRERGESFQLILTRYALERFLYRLSISGRSHEFVLKGAFRFLAWSGQVHRPTRDLDFLAYGDDSQEGLITAITDICLLAVLPPDGLEFDPGTIQVKPIRDEQAYPGQRVTLTALLGKARIAIQLDLGFGDAVTPGPESIDYPTLLNMPQPRIRAYPKESVLAEKLEAMVSLGMLNSRMKDFYDLWIMSRVSAFEGPGLCQAVSNTFGRRRTAIPHDLPIALSDEFGLDAGKAIQWKAFIGRSRLETGDAELSLVIDELRIFLWPVLQSLSAGGQLELNWSAGGGWQ